MSKFLQVLEQAEKSYDPWDPNYQDDYGTPGAQDGIDVVQEALDKLGIESEMQDENSLTFEHGGRTCKVTATYVEDEEFTDEDPETDTAAKAVRMADKATEDDPQTVQTKRNLNNSVNQTYRSLDRTLRDATRELKV
jgi:hypothetical protein